MRGDVSSQFLSGLLLAGPAMRTGLVARLVGDLVSEPYVDMTVAVMARFGVEVQRPDERTWVVEPQAYRAADLAIEPDASAASYVFAAAALARRAGDRRRAWARARSRATSPSSTCSSRWARRSSGTPTSTTVDRHRRRCAASRST